MLDSGINKTENIEQWKEKMGAVEPGRFSAVVRFTAG